MNNTNQTLRSILLLVGLAFVAAGCEGAFSSEDEAEATAYFHGEQGLLVNINTADAAELDTLPGVGPVTAGRIIADRDANGVFAAKEDITRVRGIGPRTFDKVRDLITVGGEEVDEGGEGGECDANDNLVNINTADAAELDTLPRVGPTTAGRIIADREANGDFPRTSDITRVRGIGPATFARFADLITVGGGEGCGEEPVEEEEDPIVPAPEPELRLVHINEADVAEIATLPGVDEALAAAIADRVRNTGVFVTLDEIVAETGADIAGWDGLFTLAAHQVFFTPEKDGGSGYAERNRAKTIPVMDEDGNISVESANIQRVLIDMVNRVPDGGLIQLAIYGHSTRTPEHVAIRDVVERRGVRLQVVIDTSVKNSRGVPYSADEIAAFRAFDGDVEVRTMKFKTKGMHQKFVIFDGTHVINGSANISTKANSRYDETRMAFWNDTTITGAFEAEFTRLWDDLGRLAD